jgi:hypothetical protein
MADQATSARVYQSRRPGHRTVEEARAAMSSMSAALNPCRRGSRRASSLPAVAGRAVGREDEGMAEGTVEGMAKALSAVVLTERGVQAGGMREAGGRAPGRCRFRRAARARVALREGRAAGDGLRACGAAWRLARSVPGDCG